jgi:GTP cyclohydrolase I
MIDKKKIEKAVKMIIEAIGENPNREGLRETPKRVADAYEEIFGGYKEKPIIKTFEKYGNLVCVKDIDFYSMCEHHILPFFGKVNIYYEPSRKVFGLSKIVRIVWSYARRLQIQERLTEQIGRKILEEGVKGVIVVIEAKHFCMMMRGVKSKSAKVKTYWAGGTLKDKMDTVKLLGVKKVNKI